MEAIALLLARVAALQPPAGQPGNPPPGGAPPIIVKIVEPPHDPTGLADVLLGALGLTGVIVLFAVVLGLATAGVLFWIRRRSDG